jgi:hypothetical protein
MEEVERKTKEHGKGGQAGCKWVVNVLLPFKVLDILVAFFRVCLCQQQDRRTQGGRGAEGEIAPDFVRNTPLNHFV